MTSSPDTPPVHGLVYPEGLISALPVLLSRPAPHQPIRSISAAQFAAIHAIHLTNHAPDHVLFPFLHGLEGDNEAQNHFFGVGKPGALKVPRFRGLIWVACDDEDAGVPQSFTARQSADSPTSDVDGQDDLFLDEDDEFDEDEELDFMDLDHNNNSVSTVGPDKPQNTDVDLAETYSQPIDESAYMHPVSHRPQPTPITTNPQHSHDRRSSSASSLSDSSSSSAYSESNLSHSMTESTSATSYIDSPISPTNSDSACLPETVPLPPSPPLPERPPLLTSTFHAADLLRMGSDGPDFIPPRVPDGISLRNFSIQVPVYATLSDIVVYSPKGVTHTAFQLAEKFKLAIERKAREREASARTDTTNALSYNVFVLSATLPEMLESLPHLLSRVESSSYSISRPHPHQAHTEGHDGATGGEEKRDKWLRPNTINFAQREKEEMRDLTRASEIISVFPVGEDPVDGMTVREQELRAKAMVGQVFLGNSNDVPLPPSFVEQRRSRSRSRSSSSAAASRVPEEDPFDFTNNDPVKGYGYDLCIECHDMAPYPPAQHLQHAEDHLAALDRLWEERCRAEDEQAQNLRARSLFGNADGAVGDLDFDLEMEDTMPTPRPRTVRPRPPPSASSVIHLPFPSSPPTFVGALNCILPFIAWLRSLLTPPSRGLIASPSPLSPETSPTTSPSLSPQPSSRHHSRSSSSSSTGALPLPNVYAQRSRPLKILIYSSDGYTESSVLALSLLMALRGLSLPQAYLTLQVEKRRSFFVYQPDVGLLKRIEVRYTQERDEARRRSGGVVTSTAPRGSPFSSRGTATPTRGSTNPIAMNASTAPMANINTSALSLSLPDQSATHFPQSLNIHMHDHMTQPQSAYPLSSSIPNLSSMVVPSSSSQPQQAAIVRRPRASTSPMIHPFADHQSWFDDPRFDGSFPSRVLPFLYLGNLNHACNAYMLHALGITHVVSVGECALFPPSHHAQGPHQGSGDHAGYQYIPGKGPGAQGSLWIEEREGRIKVLDIQGVCDDGIDTLEPQLSPICDWIEKARLEGGQVLVHCRVGVSRSATVTIAYVMKHLALPLVDAYLIVRSRRLSVLIQPNMRLLYNLCGWEVKLARERANGDEEQLRNELARTLNWPYLAKEVHQLNEKYLS